MAEKHAGGAPSKYKEEYAEQAAKLCLLGATDKKLADFFEVSEATINNWKRDYPKFLESIKESKVLSDSEVVKSLYERATGYTHPEIHISNYQGTITKTETVKHYPPDSTAMIFWLKNRQPELFRDKQEIDLTGKVELEVIPPVTLDDLESQITDEKQREEE